MDRVKRLLSFKGRSNRLAYWVTNLALIVPYLLILNLFYPFDSIGLRLLCSLTGLLGALLVAWVSLAVLVRRGHDRGRPALWSILVWLVSGLLPQFITPLAGTIKTALWLAALTLACYVLADYGLLKSQVAENRYGPPVSARRARKVAS